MGGTSEDAGAAERAAKFARLAGTTEALRLSTADLDAACDAIRGIAALAEVLARAGIVAGKAALIAAGVPAAAVELAGKLAEAGVEKARGKVAGA